MKKTGGSGELTPEDRRIWTRVSGSVTPPKSRKAARVPVAGPIGDGESVADAAPRPAVKPVPRRKTAATPAAPAPPPPSPQRLPGRSPPEELEPRRQRRLSRERDPIDGRLDLHGFGRFEAEDQL
ncbi:MAG: Smr/MutS family protein, partial [Brevundimonas sp.]